MAAAFVNSIDYNNFMCALHHHRMGLYPKEVLQEDEVELLSALAGSWACEGGPVKAGALRRGRRIADRVAAEVRQNKEVKP